MPYELPAASRRGFLALCSGLMAAVGTAGLTSGLAGASAMMSGSAPPTGRGALNVTSRAVLQDYSLLPDHIPHSMLDHLNCDVFAAHLNTTFRAVEAQTDLVLLRATPGRSHDPSRGQESFSLIFRGPREPILDQSIQQLHHPQLGDMSLFMVPLRQKDEGTFYEVVFNRLVPAP